LRNEIFSGILRLFFNLYWNILESACHVSGLGATFLLKEESGITALKGHGQALKEVARCDGRVVAASLGGGRCQLTKMGDGVLIPST
jgi:hypothetical protein